MGFGKPLKHSLVTDGWGSARKYRDGIHKGLDFRARVGTSLYALGAGRVVLSEDRSDTPEKQQYPGQWIVIDHEDGFRTEYMHLSRRYVRAGQRVKKGQRIGLTGDSGITRSAPHLHMQVRWQGELVPGEPLVPADEYEPDVISAAREQNLTLFGPPRPDPGRQAAGPRISWPAILIAGGVTAALVGAGLLAGQIRPRRLARI